jgi:hypothetical protein
MNLALSRTARRVRTIQSEPIPREDAAKVQQFTHPVRIEKYAYVIERSPAGCAAWNHLDNDCNRLRSMQSPMFFFAIRSDGLRLASTRKRRYPFKNRVAIAGLPDHRGSFPELIHACRNRFAYQSSNQHSEVRRTSRHGPENNGNIIDRWASLVDEIV